MELTGNIEAVFVCLAMLGVTFFGGYVVGGIRETLKTSRKIDTWIRHKNGFSAETLDRDR